MATNGKARLGTPVTPLTPTVASQPNRNVPPQQSQPPGIPPPAPVIPTSILQPNEQRLLFVSLFGLLEVFKVWDILAPYFTNPEPSWSNSLRLAGPISATAWTIAEFGVILSVGLLRIPQLSPSLSIPNLLQIGVMLIAWNGVCWLASTPGAAFELLRVDLIGPPSLGGASLWGMVKTVTWKEKPHLGGKHQIRLLPYSTATLNPLSLSYCIPPDSPQTLYIPIVFNNSLPDQVSYFVRSLETGETETKTISGSSLRRPSHSDQKLQITDEEENASGETETDPLSALVLQSQRGDMVKMPSVKPADSLAIVPQQLASSQSILFLTVDRPSLVTLKSVVDKRGDRFHIAPHKEAVIIECPTGGHFVNHDKHKGIMVKKVDKVQPAEHRCVGDEEVAQFQARGVGSLKVGWTKSSNSKEPKTSGVIEGIEEDIESVDTLGLVRRDKVSKTHTVPLRLVHDKPGIFTVALTSVTDSMHNTYSPSGHPAQKVYNVMARTTVNFNCPSPLQLLVNKTVSIPLIMGGNTAIDSKSPREISYSHRPLEGTISAHTMSLTKKNELITVSEPGVYTLQELSGECSGGVIEPSSCRVQLISPPAVDMSVTTLNEGAMDIGVNAVFEFTGTPPFRVYWTEQRKGSRLVEQSRKFEAHHGEIILQPEHEGQYTYMFKAISDRHYQDIKLDEQPIQQTVHPLANVDIPGLRDGLARRKLFSCSGDTIDIDLEAKGNPPLSLNYLLSYGSKSENKTLQIEAGRSKLGIDVPKELNADSGSSGKLSVTLLSITDGDGRIRKLPAPTVEVDIHRQKPTVRFAKSGLITITEGESTRAPLRLTGDAPWEVEYALNGGKAKRISLRDANNHLTLKDAGVYRLLQVKDANCPGVVAQDDTFEIAYKLRPQVELVTNSDISLKDGSYRHKGFCTGGEDQVALRFNGQAPYEVSYRYTTGGHTSRHTLKSAQEIGILHLHTEPGQHRYDFTELKDSNYANNPIQLALEHDVYSRPSASFIKSNTRPLCLDQSIKSDAKIRLEGAAPFVINLAIRKPASTKVVSHTLTTNSNEWALDIPITASEIGRYEVSITSISDISDCEQIVHETDKLTTTVEVVESARIVPVTQTRDLCVGDNLDFLLQGKAPWTIEYEWLKKNRTVTSSASRFSRYAEAPGNFSIHSVALKDNQCKRNVEDLLRIVHPLPSVRIQEGLVHLREGDDPASFSVHFTGTPPFTFTYTRSQLVGSRTKILDTQTVTDIMESDYTISSSQEGDYEVTSVSDRWCRYPPLTKGRNEV